MKKSTISLLVATIVLTSLFTTVCAATYTKFSSDFIKNFKDCDNYRETVNSEFEGENFTTVRTIQGWRNGFCKYEEVIKSSKGAYKLDCSFSNIQVDELYTAMKSRSKEPEKYELELFASQKDPKTGQTKYVTAGTQTIKGNKAYIVWAKYQNNPYFCKPTKITD